MSAGDQDRSPSAGARGAPGGQHGGIERLAAQPQPCSLEDRGEEARVARCAVGDEDTARQRLDDRLERHPSRSDRRLEGLPMIAFPVPPARRRRRGADHGAGPDRWPRGPGPQTTPGAREGKRRAAPSAGSPPRLRTDVPGGHHANARPPTSPRASLFWTARTSLRASRSRRRLAGSRALGST